MSQKIAVLGANSFSGQDFIDLLLGNPNYEIIGISQSSEKMELFLKYKLRNDLSRYRFFQMNANRDMPEILQLLDREKPELIVNFAAQSEVAPSWDHPEHWFQTNCVSLALLINHLRKQTYLKRYLHVSSPEVYGTCVGTVAEDSPLSPSTPYAASKAAADLLLLTYFKQFNFPLLFVRSTNVYGARQQLFKIIPRSMIRLKKGVTIELHGGGKTIKSYIHIRDISRGELAILKNGRLGQIYHLSPDRGISICNLVRIICKQMNRSFEESVTFVDERPGQDSAYIIDSTRARTELQWKPNIFLEEGLKEVNDWIEQNWREISEESLEYHHKP